MADKELEHIVHYSRYGKHHESINKNEAPYRYRIARAAKNFKFYGDRCYYVKKGTPKLVVTKLSDRKKILKKNHITPSGDHRGIELTRADISKSFYWMGITRDVKNLVKKCISCNKSKKDFVVTAQNLTISTSLVWNTVALTFLGPFNEAPQGEHEVCLLVDYTSKYIYGKATYSRERNSICRTIRTAAHQFGIPQIVILMNQGSTAEYNIDLQSLGITVISSKNYQQRYLDYFLKITEPIKKKLQSLSPVKWVAEFEPLVWVHNKTIDSTLGTSPFEKMFNRKPDPFGESLAETETLPTVITIEQPTADSLSEFDDDALSDKEEQFDEEDYMELEEESANNLLLMMEDDGRVNIDDECQVEETITELEIQECSDEPPQCVMIYEKSTNKT